MRHREDIFIAVGLESDVARVASLDVFASRGGVLCSA